MELTLTRGLLWSLECEMGTTSKGSKDFNSRLNVHHVAIGNSIFRSLGWMNSIVNFISSRLSYYRPYLYITSNFFFRLCLSDAALLKSSGGPPVDAHLSLWKFKAPPPTILNNTYRQVSGTSTHFGWFVTYDLTQQLHFRPEVNKMLRNPE